MLRRSATVAVGLLLGWYAAGFLPGSLSPSARMTPASVALAESAGEAKHPGEHSHDTTHGDRGTEVAALVSPQREEITWYRDVLVVAGLLFVAAAILGSFAAWFRGPLPPDPADTHDDHSAGHDDHSGGGHGAHGHDAHDAHGKAAHH